MKRKSRTEEAKRKQHERKVQRFRSYHNVFDLLSQGLINPQERCRSFEETKLLLLAIKASLRRTLTLDDKVAIRWYQIEEEVQKDLEVEIHYMRELRESFLHDRDVLIYGGSTGLRCRKYKSVSQ